MRDARRNRSRTAWVSFNFRPRMWTKKFSSGSQRKGVTEPADETNTKHCGAFVSLATDRLFALLAPPRAPKRKASGFATSCRLEAQQIKSELTTKTTSALRATLPQRGDRTRVDELLLLRVPELHGIPTPIAGRRHVGRRTHGLDNRQLKVSANDGVRSYRTAGSHRRQQWADYRPCPRAAHSIPRRPHYSGVEWDEQSMRDTIKRFNAAAIVIYVPTAAQWNDDFVPSPFVRQLAQGDAPSWMKLVYQSDQLFIYAPRFASSGTPATSHADIFHGTLTRSNDLWAIEDQSMCRLPVQQVPPSD